MYEGTFSGWLFFWVLFLFWRFSESQQKFLVHLIEKSQQAVKSTIFVNWGKFWRIWILKFFWRHFLLFFFKIVPALRQKSLESIFYVSGETNWLFIGVCRVLKLPEFRLNEVRLFVQKFSRLSKLQTTCVEEVLIVFFCADWTFRFSKFLWFWAIFFCILDQKKIRRVVKRAHYVSGGAFQGILFSKENIPDNSRTNSRETRNLFPKNFRHFCQNSFLRFLWNFCMEEINSRWIGPHISIFRGLSAKNQRNLSGKN